MQQLDETPLGREFVLQVTGTVTERSNKNTNIPTGDIEITVSSFTILNKSAVPPFTIQDDTDGGDDLRMKYRYLDLRRNAVKKNLELRYAVNRAAQRLFAPAGFHGYRNAIPDQINTRRRTGFCGAFPHESRAVLCSAAITANL